MGDIIEDPLLERLAGGRDLLAHPLLSPTLTRNCNTAVNDCLYRNLLGRYLGDKIEDPLLDSPAGGHEDPLLEGPGHGLQGQTASPSSPFGPGTALLLSMTVSMGTYLGGVWEVK